MNKSFEKILERLDDGVSLPKMNGMERRVGKSQTQGFGIGVLFAKEIVQEVAEEYNGGWIPCSERLPEYAEILVNCTIKRLSDGHVWVQNLIYNRIDDKWKWTDYPEDRYVDMDSFDILAWQPLPEPYKERD